MDLTLPTWMHTLGRTGIQLLPGGLFTLWCLFGVNWRRAWPVLAAGGWVPLVLIAAFAGAVWSLVWPSTAVVFGVVRVPNGLWQLGAAGVLVCIALFCGWLQDRYGWTPAEINLEPPPVSHDHGHDHHASH